MGTLRNLKKASARKLLSPFSSLLDVKQTTAVCIMGSALNNHNETQTGSDLWYNINKRSKHTKINAGVKKALYNCVLHHAQVVKSKIY